jgi:hypothetical protein
MSTIPSIVLAQFPQTVEEFVSAVQNDTEGLWSRFSALATLYQETSEENAHLKQRIEYVQESREQLQADQVQLQISCNQKIDHLREKYDAVRDQVQDLLARQATLPTPIPSQNPDLLHVPTPATSVPSSDHLRLSERLPDPAIFYGERSDLERFESQIHSKMVANVDRFPVPQQRMNYVLSRLGGIAYTQLLPYVKLGEVQLPDYQSILDILSRAFADPDRAATDRRKLQRLRQANKEFAVFFAEFQRLALSSQYPEGDLAELLEDNISAELAEMLLNNPPPSREYHAFANHLQDLENRRTRYRERHSSRYTPKRTIPMSRVFSPSPTPTVELSSVPTPFSADPMDLSRAGSPRRVSPEERERRAHEGLCFRCGGNHFRANCPLPQSSPRSRSPSTPGSLMFRPATVNQVSRYADAGIVPVTPQPDSSSPPSASQEKGLSLSSVSFRDRAEHRH